VSWLGLGVPRATGGNPTEEPEEAYRASVQAHPKSEQTLYAYAAYLFRHRRLREAKAYTDRLLALRPAHELGRELRKQIAAALASSPGDWGPAPAHPAEKEGRRDFAHDPCDRANPELASFPVIQAASAGAQAEVQQRLAAGGKIDERTAKTGLTPLICAIDTRHFELARWLLAHGASPRLRDALRRSPLSHAAQTSDVGLVRDLLARGADPKEPDGRGTTPLNYAIYWYAFNREAKTPDVIEALLTQVDVNAPCQDSGELPIQTAAYAGDPATVKLLLKHGADATRVNREYVKSEEVRRLLAAAGGK
jgi:ankyrin repeat protein